VSRSGSRNAPMPAPPDEHSLSHASATLATAPLTQPPVRTLFQTVSPRLAVPLVRRLPCWCESSRTIERRLPLRPSTPHQIRHERVNPQWAAPRSLLSLYPSSRPSPLRCREIRPPVQNDRARHIGDEVHPGPPPAIANLPRSLPTRTTIRKNGSARAQRRGRTEWERGGDGRWG